MKREKGLSPEEMDAFLESRKEKKEAIKQREVKDFVIDRLPEGLYEVRYEGGGVIPEVLRGRFTTMSKVEAIISRYKAEKGRE
jgi:hypothetical protein